MKFIITIRDEFGNPLSEYETMCEPQYMAFTDCYRFEFDKFSMILTGDAFRQRIEYLDGKSDTNGR